MGRIKRIDGYDFLSVLILSYGFENSVLVYGIIPEKRPKNFFEDCFCFFKAFNWSRQIIQKREEVKFEITNKTLIEYINLKSKMESDRKLSAKIWIEFQIHNRSSSTDSLKLNFMKVLVSK